ncbi:MAG: hypothetical protein IJ190_07630 [Prevotella sp.]|nr:hypothetical protein [Prevotella sp.]
MRKTNHTINPGKRAYEAPRAEVIILDSRTALLSVSGSDDYDDIHWGGEGSGEDGD